MQKQTYIFQITWYVTTTQFNILGRHVSTYEARAFNRSDARAKVYKAFKRDNPHVSHANVSIEFVRQVENE